METELLPPRFPYRRFIIPVTLHFLTCLDIIQEHKLGVLLLYLSQSKIHLSQFGCCELDGCFSDQTLVSQLGRLKIG